MLTKKRIATESYHEVPMIGTHIEVPCFGGQHFFIVTDVLLRNGSTSIDSDSIIVYVNANIEFDSDERNEKEIAWYENGSLRHKKVKD